VESVIRASTAPALAERVPTHHAHSRHFSCLQNTLLLEGSSAIAMPSVLQTASLASHQAHHHPFDWYGVTEEHKLHKAEWRLAAVMRRRLVYACVPSWMMYVSCCLQHPGSTSTVTRL
jgi:hypothetical protein